MGDAPPDQLKATSVCESYRERASSILDSNPAKTSDPSEYGKAIELLQESQKKCGSDSNLLTLMAKAKFAIGDNDEAYSYAKQALSIDPTHWEANYFFGHVLTMTGENDRGLRHIELALKNAPKRFESNVRLGYCSSLESAKKFESAIEICTKVIAEKKNNGMPFYIRARAYEALGKQQLATRDYEQAKKLGFDGAPYYSKEHYEK